MSYPSEWKADEEGRGGLAVFIVEGTRREFRLESFAHFLGVGNMLEAAFNQGKSFAFDCTRIAIERAMKDAKSRHAL